MTRISEFANLLFGRTNLVTKLTNLVTLTQDIVFTESGDELIPFDFEKYTSGIFSDLVDKP